MIKIIKNLQNRKQKQVEKFICKYGLCTTKFAIYCPSVSSHPMIQFEYSRKPKQIYVFQVTCNEPSFKMSKVRQPKQ